MSFGKHKYVFLLGMYPELELLCPRVSLSSALLVIAKKFTSTFSEQNVKNNFPGLFKD